MRHPFAKTALAAAATVAMTSAALAHVGDHSQIGFGHGFAHPFTGLDHLLAMIAVGLWAWQIGGRALWALPLMFPAVMAVGAAAGIGGAPLSLIEIAVAGSVLVLGAAVALKLKPSLAVSLPLIALFAALHGYAHGVELPADASALGYAAGFVAATFALHGVGIAIGFAASRVPVRFVARAAGGAIACAGLVLLVLPH